MKLFIQIYIMGFMCAFSLSAHGDLDLRIKAVTELILSHPDSAELYFQRGKLKFQHEEYRSSIDDIDLSISKGYTHELHEIYLAKSYYKLEDYQQAHRYLQNYLKYNPNNVVALNLKARILFAQKKFEKSAIHFEQVIQYSIRSLPENYLEAANSWLASDADIAYERSINILELGIQNLGKLITLQNQLIEIHILHNNKEAALNIQKEIIEKTKRKETAYFRLAELYVEFGENDNAKKAASRAEKELEKLPKRIRSNTAMKLLKSKIQQLSTKLI